MNHFKETANQDEDRLISTAQMGDLDAFNQLVLKYQEMVYNQAYWMLNDPDRAEDLTQETFLKAFRKLSGFEHGSFRGWLLRIITNACLDELKRMKRHPIISLFIVKTGEDELDSLDWLADPGPSVEEQVELFEMRANLQRHIDMLNPDHRAVLVFVDILGLDYLEVAGALRIPVGTVKSRLWRARLQLKDRLEKSRTWQYQGSVSAVVNRLSLVSG